jgi:hypothetical protein
MRKWKLPEAGNLLDVVAVALATFALLAWLLVVRAGEVEIPSVYVGF